MLCKQEMNKISDGKGREVENGVQKEHKNTFASLIEQKEQRSIEKGAMCFVQTHISHKQNFLHWFVW